MRRLTIVATVLAIIAVGYLGLGGFHPSVQAGKDGPMIGHMVYFTLKDNSDAAKKKLIDACKKHLSKHEGEVFFAAGSLVVELKREVNDRDWDVALHIVFANMAAHDKYQDHPRHKAFIDENKENWKKVRVFDSLVEK
jgi:hypothetical protein